MDDVARITISLGYMNKFRKSGSVEVCSKYEEARDDAGG